MGRYRGKVEEMSQRTKDREDYTDATPEERIVALEALGLSLKATFVPFSQSKHAKPAKGEKVWRSLNWTVTVSRAGRDILTTEYAQGEGHCPAYKNPPKFPSGKPDLYHQSQLIAWECEHGKVARMMSSVEYTSAGKPIPVPSLLEVCYSLAMDAQAGRESFEDFCSSFGYDEDSRKAEMTWRACADTYRALGADLTEQMAKITEGY